MPRAWPGMRSDRAGRSSASRWYCAARTPLKPKARAISACDGGTPSALDALGDQGEDGLLGIGQVHG